MFNKKVEFILQALVASSDVPIDSEEVKIIFDYIKKLERDNFGLKQKKANLEERLEKIERYIDR